MARFKKPVNENESYITFTCPGCKEQHHLPVLPHPRGWTFNGDFDRPTLSPSILAYPYKRFDKNDAVYETPLCHSFVRDGQIQFLGDCTHALAGQTVDLPEIQDADA